LYETLRIAVKKISCFLLVVFFLCIIRQSDACVGRILNIGIVNSLNENVLAELISVLINERTGTTVTIKVFESPEEIYRAVKTDEVGIVIENTDHALSMLNTPKSDDKKKDYHISKKEYREKYSLIWLKPFGFMAGDQGRGEHYYSAVITEDVLINFPALPRVINKLKGISNDKLFSKVLKSVKSGEKVKRVVRDYLKKKKLI
jgi:glycine betaine/choline ABC-type transport system substrate-binding protein